jgi:hypothetical protein
VQLEDHKYSFKLDLHLTWGIRDRFKFDKVSFKLDNITELVLPYMITFYLALSLLEK